MPFSNIDKPSKYFDTQLFTGTNTSGRTFTGLNFQPDMIWGKQRDSASYNHFIVDVVRGGTKFIATNTTAAEDTASHGQITSWNSDGTTWSDGTNGTYPRLYYNDNGQLGGSGTRVWWQWKANGAGVSNTQGTISSTVSANTTSGFSVVSYTGNGTAGATVGHGLGVAPKMVIVKRRDGAVNWIVYHSGIGATKYLELNTTEVAQLQSSFNMFNSTAPSSSLITLGNLSNTNGNTNTYIAYCFAEVKGFSKAFSYTGNGSSDGTFIYTGMRPAWVLVKRTDTTGNWYIWDIKRNTFNVMDITLYPNSTTADITASDLTIDSLSNGFKIRGTSIGINASGGTYIGFAIAEQPFVSSKGIVANAR